MFESMQELLRISIIRINAEENNPAPNLFNNEVNTNIKMKKIQVSILFIRHLQIVSMIDQYQLLQELPNCKYFSPYLEHYLPTLIETNLLQRLHPTIKQHIK
jgi:hypothetical protein